MESSNNVVEMRNMAKMSIAGGMCNKVYDTPLENAHHHLKEGFFSNLFYFDPFTGKVYIDENQYGLPANSPLEDRYVEEFRYVMRDHGIGVPGFGDLYRTIVSVSMNFNRRDSLQGYFDSLPEWDGIPRIALFLADYCNAENTDYHSVIGRKFLISAVARAYASPEAPSKVDAVLVLEGKQGVGKTSLLTALCPINSWSRTINGKLEDKDTKIKLHSGVFMAEFSEFTSIKKASAIEYVKSFISETCDSFRPPYAKNEVIHARRNVFIGTINPSAYDGYLTDQTGNRRFWVAKVGERINLDNIRRDRDQIWAEAKLNYQNGNEWWLEGTEIDLHQQEVAKRVVSNEYADLVVDYLLNNPGVNEISIGKLIDHVFGDAAKTGSQYSRLQKKVSAVLTDLGWQKIHTRNGNVWMKPIAQTQDNTFDENLDW